jgi:hypothetical protein
MFDSELKLFYCTIKREILPSEDFAVFKLGGAEGMYDSPGTGPLENSIGGCGRNKRSSIFAIAQIRTLGLRLMTPTCWREPSKICEGQQGLIVWWARKESDLRPPS